MNNKKPSNNIKSTIAGIISEWNLFDYSRYLDTGKEIKWQGTQTGILKYATNGMMSVKIERSHIQKEIDPLDEKRLNIWYRGRFKVVADCEVLHIIEQASDENRVGKTLVRKFTVDESTLTLEGWGLRERVMLVWKRL